MEQIKVNAVQVAALAGLVLATALSVVSVPLGMRAFSLVLIVLAVVRAVGPASRVLVARSRGFDIAMLLLLGGTIGYLSFSPDL